MFYRLHELRRGLALPGVHLAHATARALADTREWFGWWPWSPHLAASSELMYRLGKEYPKPEFGIRAVQVRGVPAVVQEQVALSTPFCRLLRFRRYSDDEQVLATIKRSPTVLVVAPLSGHHATLLRDTVQALLADHDVYITDWVDARMVPLAHGAFSLDDYVVYVRDCVRHIGTERLHLLGVCQGAVPVLAAVAQMAAAGEPTPRSLTLMGGPIDTRYSPTAVNDFATSQPLRWFEENLLHEVPPPYPGRGRVVYPGFLQHAAFISMNLERHVGSHWDFYQSLVEGDHAQAEAHRRFYDEYNAVLDMAAEYYIDCVRIVFQEHLLPRGAWRVAGEPVAPQAIRDAHLLTIEGQLDDITGFGQTRAAHLLCTGIPAAHKHHLLVEGAGHYGIFSGSRWRDLVYPRVREFIAASEGTAAVPVC